MGFRTRLVVAIVGLLAYFACTNTALTGIFIHEWLSVGIAVLLAVHTAANWDWAWRVLSQFPRKLMSISRLNAVVDILLLAMFAAVMVSGILESRVVLPTLGIPVPFGITWRILHSLAAKLLLIAMGVHVGLHWRWIVHAIRKWPRTVGVAAQPGTEAGVNS